MGIICITRRVAIPFLAFVPLSVLVIQIATSRRSFPYNYRWRPVFLYVKQPAFQISLLYFYLAQLIFHVVLELIEILIHYSK